MSFYWITRLDAIVVSAIIIGSVLLIMALIAFFIGLAEEWNKEDEDDKPKIRTVRSMAIAGFIFILIAIFTPDTNTACAIYFVDYLQENKDERELPDKVIKSANLYFDKLIEDLGKDKEGEEVADMKK